MVNYAICLKDDENFKAGFIYECSPTYNGMVDVLNSNNGFITMDADDKDFTFIFNVTNELKEIIESKYAKVKYNALV